MIISLVIVAFLHSNSWSRDCRLGPNSSDGVIQEIYESLGSTSTQTFECVEQEVLDVIVEPIRLQSFAMKQCEARSECKVALIKEAARVSKLEESRFENLNAVALWGEIQKFSALNRIATLQFSDLPLADNPEELFEKIKTERIASRTLSKSENMTMACVALVALIGPGKFKVLKSKKLKGAVSSPLKTTDSSVQLINDFPITNPAKVSIFKKFDQSKNKEFKARLENFRGNDNIDFDPTMHGREGQIFTSRQYPGLAIKRFFASSEIDPWEGVRLLEEANTVVQAQPKVSRLLSVVKVVERGPDFIVREFDPKSVPLKSIMSRDEVAQAIIELKRELRYSTDSRLKKIYNKLDRDKPSENLHWSPVQKKILLIDITYSPIKHEESQS